MIRGKMNFKDLLEHFSLVGKDFRYEEGGNTYCGPIKEVRFGQGMIVLYFYFEWLAIRCQEGGTYFWKAEYNIQNIEVGTTVIADVDEGKGVITIETKAGLIGEIYLNKRYLIFEDIRDLV
jgi:hypothetical protein